MSPGLSRVADRDYGLVARRSCVPQWPRDNRSFIVVQSRQLPVRHEPADSNDAVVNLETVLLEVVGGTVECRIDQAVNAQSFPSHSFDDGRFQLQHVSKVVASGHVKTILNRPALRVETLA